MKTVKKCPAIFHIPDLQLAKTYSSVQDFFFIKTKIVKKNIFFLIFFFWHDLNGN